MQHGYGLIATPESVTARVMEALERKVLQPPAATALLREYFETMLEEATTAYSAGDDGISDAPLDELEQTALLFVHYDADGDGLLSHDECGAHTHSHPQCGSVARATPRPAPHRTVTHVGPRAAQIRRPD